MRHPAPRPAAWLCAAALTLLAGPFLAPTGAAGAPAANCAGTGTGLVPLTDLGGGTYQTYPGGLYPGGLNVPPPRQAELAAAAASSIRPLDVAGAPAADGRVVLLSVGMSNATQEYSAFVQAARSAPGLHRALAIVDGAQGGQTAAVIRDGAANFWRVVDQRLAAAGTSAAQVQVIWLKEANARPTQPFPVHAQSLTDDLVAVVGVARQRYPNLKLVYLASRTYGGYASTNLNPEPFAYEGGFSMRWLIERQIAGAAGLNADPERGPVEAPVLLWGPYLWADGLSARSDGLTWRCEDFVDDGTHPSTSGRAQVAGLLLHFFQTEASSRAWFLADPNAPIPTAAPTRTAGPTVTPGGPTRTPGATPAGGLRSYRLREAPSGDRFWITTDLRQVQDRLEQVDPNRPAWLCGAVVPDPAAEWGFNLDRAPLTLERNAEPARQTTLRAIAADPAAAAAANPRCLRIDGYTEAVEGLPPGARTPTPPAPSPPPTDLPTALPTVYDTPVPATPTSDGPVISTRLVLPIAWRSR